LETGRIAAGHMPHATATRRAAACLIATGGNRIGCTRLQHVAATPATCQLAAKTKHPHFVSPPHFDANHVDNTCYKLLKLLAKLANNSRNCQVQKRQ